VHSPLVSSVIESALRPRSRRTSAKVSSRYVEAVNSFYGNKFPLGEVFSGESMEPWIISKSSADRVRPSSLDSPPCLNSSSKS
jgi:hypothetical protein